jgi:glucan endo-1,3-beta-D-glucosidase
MFILEAFLAVTFAAVVGAQYKGFNYGAVNGDGSTKVYWHFHDEFIAAQNLVGAPGFTSARLYTSIQGGSQNAPIEAIKAAIDTKTSLLLGVWASSGQDHVNQEIAAIQQAINNWGSSFTNLVVGISVGSEDLYRISPTGIENKSDPGAQPADVVKYINQVRSALGKSIGKPIGHVDTWSAWVNETNSAVVTASDFLGFGTC